MTVGFMVHSNPLFVLLNDVMRRMKSTTWGLITSIDNEWGHLGIEYGEVEEGEYADIVFMLPNDMYAVIDDGTYGTLSAIRIFRDDAE